MEEDDENEDETNDKFGGKLDKSSSTIASYRLLAEECTKYLHIATLLMNLSIPTKMKTLFPELESLYDNLAAEYSFRLPFWKLITDPWPLLEPLMIFDSEIGPKLSPLCPFLNIERDDFYVKRAIHLYTRSSLQSATTIASPKASSEPSSGTLLSPQMESLLKEIHDIASCTKKPLTRVKIWRLVYEMEQDRNSSVALKALETALEVFDQLSSITSNMATDPGDLQTYHDMKYETTLELVKHKSKEILLGMQAHKMNLIRHDSNPTWKTILSSDNNSIVARLTPFLGDITGLLKVFFETVVLEEVWVIQLNALRKTASATSCLLTVHDLLDEPLLPVVAEYLKFIGEVAVKLYEIHSTLESFNTLGVGIEDGGKEHTSTSTPNNPLTSSILQVVRHSQIGKLLADVDVPGSSADSRVMKSASSQSSQTTGGGTSLMGGLWGTISSSDSVVSPSSAELRRREDVFRAFGIAALLATCTPSCPRSIPSFRLSLSH